MSTGRVKAAGASAKGAVLIGHNHKLPGAFNFSVAHYDYHTARGVRLEGRGVTPDYVIKKRLRNYVEARDPDMEFLMGLMTK